MHATILRWAAYGERTVPVILKSADCLLRTLRSPRSPWDSVSRRAWRGSTSRMLTAPFVCFLHRSHVGYHLSQLVEPGDL